MKLAVNLKMLKGAVALAAILAVSGSAMAKKNSNGGGLPADLSDDRTEVTLDVSDLPACPLSTSGTLSVYVFQSVGRLINIGTYSGVIPCSGAPTTVEDIIVRAVPGLTFQPGPATLLIRYTATDAMAQPTITETGARINLH
jgi:hypothetical protein